MWKGTAGSLFRCTGTHQTTPSHLLKSKPQRSLLRMEKNTDAENDLIIRAAEAIKQSKWLVFTSGAGLVRDRVSGVDSGLPDFRGDSGFWKAYPPMKDLGLQMSTPHWFQTDPTFAWGFWAHRYNLYSSTKPHAGFEIMKRLGEEKEKAGGGYFSVTSNVDGQWQKAGFPEEKILEVHGSIHYHQCQELECAPPHTEVVGRDNTELWEGKIWPVEKFNVQFDEKTFRASPPLPKCKHCNNIARPNVLMFSDGQWHDHREQEQRERYLRFVRNLKQDPPVVLEIGAGLAVPTIQMTGEQLVSRYNGTLIRINPRDTALPDGGRKHIAVPLGGKTALEKIAAELWK